MTDFYFKGSRNYLHGTTIFDYILSNHCPSAPRNIDFLIHRQTSMQCTVTPFPAQKIVKEKVIGEFSSNYGKLIICETDNDITCRLPYDEEKLHSQCVIDQQTITIPKIVEGFSDIEKIISAYKHLLTNLFKPEYNNFLFARILLEALQSGTMTIGHDRIISRRYFQSTIWQNGRKIGALFFGGNQK